MKTLLRTLALGLALCGAAAFAVPADSLKLDSPVVDQAGVIADDAEITLNAQLRQWRAQGLMQGAVVLVDSTDGMSDFDYAMQIAKRWQLGDKVRDDGLLLLVAVNDRNLRFVSGSGIEGALPDISAKKIIRETITPYFRSGDYAGGVRAGFEAAAARLAADPAVQAEMVAADRKANGRQNAVRLLEVLFKIMLPLLFILAIVMNILRKHSEYGSRQHKMARAVFALAMGGSGGLFFWLNIQRSFLIALSIALFIGIQTFRDSGARITRRRDDDDHWSGGGFGSDGGFGGGGGFDSGGYGGDGGSFSGGGAGGSW